MATRHIKARRGDDTDAQTRRYSDTHRHSEKKIYRKKKEHTMSRAMEAVLASHLPEHICEWKTWLFRLCRRLRGMPELEGVAARNLRHVVEHWHSLTHYVPSIEEVWDEFQFGYQLVRTPIGDGSSFLEIVSKEIDDMDTTDEWIQQYHGTAQRLIKVCLVLQRMAGNDPFFLSCRIAGELCRVSHDRANKLLRVLREDGVIKVVEKGKGKNATTYRFTA